MVRGIVLAAVAAVALAGCENNRDIETAQALVSATLKDPASVQFRDVKRGRDGVVCGEFNAKNSYGGYVGFRRFAAHTRTNEVFVRPDLSQVEPGSDEAIVLATQGFEFAAKSGLACVPEA